MSQFRKDAIFWIELEKIKPNPFQPRREFDHERLNSLADSIRQYGLLQPVTVTRMEKTKEDGGLMVYYELVSGERRLRASRIAGLSQIPAIIRDSEADDEGLKLELAIIENLQREDLNPIDRAKAFERLIKDFNLKHIDVAKKIGKSRVYVTNSLRLLELPDEMKQAVAEGQIMEGHTRPLLMLKDRPEEQTTLYKEVLYKKLTVRDAESIARKIAYERARKKDLAPDPELADFEEKLAESLGTRVQIERRETGGKVVIDFFTNEEVKKIIDILKSKETKKPTESLENYEANLKKMNQEIGENNLENQPEENQINSQAPQTDEEDENEDEELYSLKDFNI